ncbi:MAG TPA: HD domain-containing protein, partial [Bacillota bacterium]|nr:HD domain-containing protein [Bacillota bacterium]
FKDPVHRYVRVRDQVIWDLIATPEFQRLRRIKQLGTSYLTFHGAEHSRFNHSLGVYEIVRRILNKFADQNVAIDQDTRLISLCAALLHDLGHGPFSHSFEKVFHLDHEDFTRQIILGHTKVNDILTRVAPNFPEQVARVIDQTFENTLVVHLISSQIDADRMDYLQRDAYYTGVSYGHFDMERILRVMRAVDGELVIKSTGMHAVEDYIMSRYQMYWQVYFHPVTRSAEVILINILQRVKDLYEQGYTFKVAPTHFESFFTDKINLQQYLHLDEAIMLYYFQQWQFEDDHILSDLCDRFMNRRLFKYVEYDRVDEERVYNRLVQLFKNVNIDPKYYLIVDKSSDLPYDVYGGLDDLYETMPIYLRMPDHSLKELSAHSPIVEAISGKRRTDYKLYFPLDDLEDLPDDANKREIFTILAYQM